MGGNVMGSQRCQRCSVGSAAQHTVLQPLGNWLHAWFQATLWVILHAFSDFPTYLYLLSLQKRAGKDPMVFFSLLSQSPAGWIQNHITSPPRSPQSFRVNYSECFSMGGATFSRPSLKATRRRVCTVITTECIWLQ